MFFYIFLSLESTNKKEILDKTVFILWSQILETMIEKGPLKTLEKEKLSTIFGGFLGLNDSSNI